VGPRRRLRLMGPMAVGTCAVLVVTVLRPGPQASMAIFALSGTFGVYQLAANAAFVARVPNERRSQAFGLANAGVVVGQGVFFMLAGAAAQRVSPALVIAAGGGAGTLAALVLAVRWRKISPPLGRHSAKRTSGSPGRALGARPLVRLAAPVPETRPNETRPNETRPNETRPHETRPRETRPHETRPHPVHARSRATSSR
jgi:Major Facilitator Superfamily